MSPDKADILNEARRRAAALLENLRRHQADLSVQRTSIGPEALTTGREAVRDAVDSAMRLMESIGQAQDQRSESEPE